MKNSESGTVVVTGASAGVGRATVQAFAQEGAKIGLLARGVERLQAAAHEAEAAGGTALAIPVDVADAAQVEAAAEKIERELGPIDVWINNAMVTVFSRFADLTPEEFHRVTEVTYLGTVYGTMSALRRMQPRNHGCIVQVGSALAYRSIPLQAAYCGAKHAMLGFTDSIRSELLHDGSDIHITVVHLPAMNTPQFDWCRTHLPRQPQPVPPIYEPEVAARAILWASRHRRREVLVGAPTMLAIEGNKVAPNLGDRYLAATGFDSQMTAEPVPAHRPDNLFSPAPGDFGARGRFDGNHQNVASRAVVAAKPGLALLAGAGVIGLTLAAIRHSRKHS